MNLAVGEIGADLIEVTFTDDGHQTPIDPTSVSLPDSMSEHGRGLAIAHRVLDELSYRRDVGGNHWTLVLRRTG